MDKLSTAPAVSIIITNWNGKKYLKRCIDSLQAGHFKDFETILVDNGSQDGSAQFVLKEYPDVCLIRNPRNLGLARASNQGARHARGRYLFFFNNDTVSDPRLLESLVQHMESHPRTGIAGCVTKSFKGGRVLNAGVACDRFGYPYGKGQPLYVDAGIFIRREIFEKVNGFDEQFFIYKEDVDLCWRVLLLGFEVDVVHGAEFRHDSACSLDGEGGYQTTIRKRFLSEAYTLRMLLKNWSFGTLIHVLPVYVLINIGEFFFFLFRAKPGLAFGAYAASYFWNLRMLADTLRKRHGVQAARKVSDEVILKRMVKGSGKWQFLREHGVPTVKGLD